MFLVMTRCLAAVGRAPLALFPFLLAGPFLAAPSCDDADPVEEVSFWIDETTGLVWQDPPRDSVGNGVDFWAAADYCAGLGDGGWRLPTIDELRSLIRGCPATELGGECAISDPECLDSGDPGCWGETGSCDGCTSSEGPGESGFYWPLDIHGDGSTEFASSSDDTWEGSLKQDSEGDWYYSYGYYLDFREGRVSSVGKGEPSKGVRCVREEAPWR